MRATSTVVVTDHNIIIIYHPPGPTSFRGSRNTKNDVYTCRWRQGYV